MSSKLKILVRGVDKYIYVSTDGKHHTNPTEAIDYQKKLDSGIIMSEKIDAGVGVAGKAADNNSSVNAGVSPCDRPDGPLPASSPIRIVPSSRPVRLAQRLSPKPNTR